jgi:hypothetical protein
VCGILGVVNAVDRRSYQVDSVAEFIHKNLHPRLGAPARQKRTECRGIDANEGVVGFVAILREKTVGPSSEIPSAVLSCEIGDGRWNGKGQGRVIADDHKVDRRMHKHPVIKERADELVLFVKHIHYEGFSHLLTEDSVA